MSTSLPLSVLADSKRSRGPRLRRRRGALGSSETGGLSRLRLPAATRQRALVGRCCILVFGSYPCQLAVGPELFGRRHIRHSGGDPRPSENSSVASKP